MFRITIQSIGKKNFLFNKKYLKKKVRKRELGYTIKVKKKNSFNTLLWGICS